MPNKHHWRMGCNALHHAATKGHASIVELLLQMGNFDINEQAGKYEKTPLAYAVQTGHYEVVEKLLGTGNVNLWCRTIECIGDGRYERTPLDIAVDSGQYAIAKELKEAIKKTDKASEQKNSSNSASYMSSNSKGM